MNKLVFIPVLDEVKGQSYKDQPIVVVPNQSMSIQEIWRRFTRREAVPAEKEGIYTDKLGDLEKLRDADITVRHERAATLKEKIKAAQKRMADKAQAEKEEAIRREIERSQQRDPQPPGTDTPKPSGS